MKLSIGAVGFLAMVFTPLVGSAQEQEAEVSANVGFVSEYFYRGLPQNDGGDKGSSGSAGLDVALGSVYLGTWSADVGDGNEVDLYAGFGREVEDFSFSVGGTGYFYTGDFDDTYLEVNLNAGTGALSAEFSFGRYKTFPKEQNYTFVGITLEEGGFYATYGAFGKDFGGDYVEAGYGLSVGDLDLSAAWIYGTADLIGGGPGSDDHTLVFGIGHTFDLD
jgi:uncharacterized protein (TIGR02001 family)